ncbi:MAG: putative hydrolase of the superfamily [Actinomycetota bacterium]|nr:putative hydrolase of the superfamily [Actinomycetota bacterium]
MPLPELEAVTFDYWNTLVWEERGHLRGLRIEAWAGLLEEAGFTCERTLLDAVFEESWSRYVEHWTTNQQYQSVTAAEDLLERLGFDVPKSVRRQLIEAFSAVGAEATLHLTDGIEDCLHALKCAGLALGIICDVGMTASTYLRAHLDKAGVLELFDHWSFSDEVGHYKPSRVIFEHALAGLGDVTPALAAHVGDIRRTDIAGAKAMGMLAVRYTGVSDDVSSPEPEGDLVIAHHRELAPALGL